MATHRHGAGSSPRGRGKPKAPKTVKLTVRLIPARAGKTPWTASLSISRPAHPRAGGENAINSMGAGIAEGSSPRGRGKPYGLDSQLALSGLIPARAGKTPSTASLSTSRPAHPRAGGENRMSLIAWSRATGSSPRGRGKLTAGLTAAIPVRLIPARAGKTARPGLTRHPTTAHPRAGGENCPHAHPGRVGRGSSPRGRGKLSERHPTNTPARLIPARAGKTLKAGHARCRPCGSSPRGRGKPIEDINSRLDGGLIPARAGKTSYVGAGGAAWWAHPRAGGENRKLRGEISQDEGSSPRGRGKHFLTCAFIERIGQILETLELAVSSGSYSLCDVYATDAPQDQARNTGLALPSSRAAS